MRNDVDVATDPGDHRFHPIAVALMRIAIMRLKGRLVLLISRKATVVMMLSLVLVLAVGALAGAELDPRYVDRDGDLVADLPENERDWRNPRTLIFSYSPVEDPAVYEEVFAELTDYLQDRLDRRVQWYGVQSTAAQIEAMRAGRLHISGFASGSVQDAVNVAGFVPQVAMGTENGMVGYRMAIIAHKDSDIKTVDDLKGRKFAFVSESSGSGYFAPRAILYEQFGMLPGRDYDVVFSGSHDNSILGVQIGDYEVAAVASNVVPRMAQGGRIQDPEGWMHTVFQSALFPVTAYGVANNLHPDLQAEIKQAFLEFDWEGTMLNAQWEEEDRFVEVNYAQDWEIMRTIRTGSATVAELLGE